MGKETECERGVKRWDCSEFGCQGVKWGGIDGKTATMQFYCPCCVHADCPCEVRRGADHFLCFLQPPSFHLHCHLIFLIHVAYCRPSSPHPAPSSRPNPRVQLLATIPQNYTRYINLELTFPASTRFLILRNQPAAVTIAQCLLPSAYRSMVVSRCLVQ